MTGRDGDKEGGRGNQWYHIHGRSGHQYKGANYWCHPKGMRTIRMEEWDKQEGEGWDREYTFIPKIHVHPPHPLTDKSELNEKFPLWFKS